jgi:hypothetical protein
MLMTFSRHPSDLKHETPGAAGKQPFRSAARRTDERRFIDVCVFEAERASLNRRIPEAAVYGRLKSHERKAALILAPHLSGFYLF